MKFPGKRKSKHYFPVNARDPLLQQFQPENETSAAWVVGIDQTLVDIEAKVDDEFIERYGLSAGHSLVIEDDVAEALYQELKQKNLITHQFAGGTIGNTMHNYSVLAGYYYQAAATKVPVPQDRSIVFPDRCGYRHSIGVCIPEH